MKTRVHRRKGRRARKTRRANNNLPKWSNKNHPVFREAFPAHQGVKFANLPPRENAEWELANMEARETINVNRSAFPRTRRPRLTPEEAAITAEITAKFNSPFNAIAQVKRKFGSSETGKKIAQQIQAVHTET